MDSAGAGGTLPPNFMLTPQQQSLLFAALNSNKAQSNGNSGTGLTLSPDSFEHNPLPNGGNGFQESPFLDNYNYEDVGDSSFDFSLIDDQPKMIGELPGSANSDSADGEGNEKRSHPDDDDDESVDPKRRESTDKAPKKPGRKPLTSEPTSVCTSLSIIDHLVTDYFEEAESTKQGRSKSIPRAQGEAPEGPRNSGRGVAEGVSGHDP